MKESVKIQVETLIPFDVGAQRNIGKSAGDYINLQWNKPGED
ncbi:hypothetical protein [Dyadobacter sediminis]|nr:hypothetical protein [Dyadobacter sediminis]